MVPERVAAALRGAARPVCAYVYDTAALRSRAAAVRAALPPSATLLYAVKANGHPAVVAALAQAADGLEVASGGELDLAVAAGARRIAFGGPAKTPAELSAAVAAGATLNVESPLELRRLGLVAGERPVRVALRVNRAGAAVAGSHQMTGTATPFGIDETDLGPVVVLARGIANLDLVGFHLHAVSNSVSAPDFGNFVRDAVAWSRDAAARYGVDLREVNVGGGFGVDYTGSGSFDLALLHDSLADLPGPPLVFELGRYLAAEAGWYAAEVLDLKRTHGRWFAVLRGGTHHFRLPAAWGYSHPFTVLPMPWTEPLPDRPAVHDVALDAVGELCTPRDVLARDHQVAEVRVGDVLVFAKAGAYGYDISHREYLRHPYPQLLVI
ncbi:MAG: decarboxylase [Actinobacteria bacterium 13_2_20CM_2_71_6]|nr:MAG: decarboxylase [Actinobacteria bacterium 13_2_20CM_2_71_6]